MKLLVVDDDKRLAQSLARGLKSEGFTVDVVHDGNDGLWMATESEYDAIVLDLMLPGSDGYEICGRLRLADDWTPILMLTARDEESSETHGLAIGADAYLTKPVSIAVLAAHIRCVVRRHARRTAAPLEVGELRIDPNSRRVWSRGNEVKLTQREFDILEYLMRHHGQAVTKDAILRGVWEFDFDGSTNIVQVYVTRLRRKLGEGNEHEHIQTVHGVGYRLHGNVA